MDVDFELQYQTCVCLKKSSITPLVHVKVHVDKVFEKNC